MVAALGAGATAGEVAAATLGRTVVGSWTIDVTPTVLPAFVSLATFNEDGGFTETNSLAIGSPPESPGHGRWLEMGPMTFGLTFWNLLGDGSGNLTGKARIRSNMTLRPSGDQWRGPFQVDVYDTSGTLVFSDIGTVEATRIKFEPLP